MKRNKKNTILVVDDDRTVLKLITAMLENEGFRVTACVKVLDAMKALSREEPPALIISDIHMPDIDGWSFCRLLRMPEYLEFNEVPVLMISATFLTDEIRRISLENGADDYLAVPFTAAELLEKTESLIQGKTKPEWVDILIVEPDAERMRILQEAFEERGFRTLCGETPGGVPPVKKFPPIMLYNTAVDGILAVENVRRVKNEHPDTAIIALVSRDFPSPPSALLYAGAAAVRRDDVDVGELTEAAVAVGKQAAILQAGSLIKSKMDTLRESEERYRFLVENITDAIFQLDAEGRFTYASPVIRRLSGYTSEEVAGRAFAEFVHPDDLPGLMASYEKTMNGELEPSEFRALDRDGGVHHVRTSSRPVYRDGVFDGFTVVMSDITEEIKAKEELARERHLFAMLMDTVPDHIYFKNQESRFIRINRSLAQSFGIDHTDRAIGKSDSDYFSEEHAKKAFADEKRILETGKPLLKIEEKETWPDGRVTWVSTTKMPMYDSAGRLEGTFGISRDITERRRAEEEIKLQKERLENIIEGTNAGTWEWNVRTGETRFNEHWAEMIGYTLEELSPVSIETWKRFIHPDDLKASEDALEKHFRGETDFYSIEFRMKHKNGGWVWVLDHGKVITRTPDGKPLWMYGTHQDITRRKTAEDAVRAERKKLSDIINTMPSPVFFKNEEGRYEECNSAFEEYLGIPREKILGATVYDIAPSELAETYHRMDLDLMASKGRQVYESKVKYADGSLRDVVFYKSPLPREDGTVRGLVGMMLDITERKRAEEALETERAQMLSVFDSIDMAIYVADMDTHEILFANKKLQETFDKTLVGGICYREIQRQDTPCPFCTNDTIRKMDYRPYRWEYYNTVVDRHYQITDRVIRWPDGRDVRFEMAMDITERKRAEEAIIKAKEEWERTFDAVPDLICLLDPEYRIARLNRAFSDRLGREPGELIGTHCYECLHGADTPPDFCPHTSTIRDHRPHTLEVNNERLGGTFIVSTTPMFDPSGGFIGSVLTAHDITERKRAEEALMESESRYRHLFTHAPAGIYEVDFTTGRFVSINSIMREYSGYTEEELLTMSPLEILTPESRNYFLSRLEKFAAGETISNDPEYQILKKDGSSIWVQLNADYIIKDGHITGARSVAHDITDRKRAEEAIEKRLRYERALSNCSRELLASETGVDAINPSLGHLLAATGTGRVYMFENFDDPEYGLCMRQTHEACAPGVTSELDNPELQRIPYREGFERWREKLEGGMPVMGMVKDFPTAEREVLEPQGILSLLVIPVSAGGRWHGFIGFDDTEREREWDANDIFILNTAAEMIGAFIERSRAYEAVRESERQMRLILNSQDVGVVIVEEASHEILFINRKALSLFGAPEEEVLGRVCHNFLCRANRGECPVTDLGQDLDNAERTLSTVDGGEVPILKSVVRVFFQGRNCLVESFVDITERKQAEDRIKGLLTEKDLLLREVHHRIKNNMTTISSLLSIQSRTLDDERAVSALGDARGRIQSMMVIYDKLYRSTDFREVSAAGYFDELIEGIASTFPAARRVTVRKNIEDQTLDSKTLFPLGIIVNELMSNAFKYAFPDGREGNITVSFSTLKDGSKELVFQDDGVGMPESVGNKPKGFGLELVDMLAKQVGGKVEIEGKKGTRFSIVFKIKEPR